MKKIIKIVGLTIAAIVVVCGISFLTDKSTYNKWAILNNSQSISWAKFEWTNEELNGKYFEKTAMFIPCRVDGITNPFTFQFDLGADLTRIYENAFSSFYSQSPKLEQKIKRLSSRLQFWDNRKSIENVSISFGNYKAINKNGFLHKNFGKKEEIKNENDTIHLGTIGADLFREKVLIIDYPNKHFAICDRVPSEYQKNLIDIELDKGGRVILPMKIRNKNYRIIFDNGSSLFPIMTLAKNISNYSSSADIDTIQISSWGKTHSVTGKLIKDTFELAGLKFSNVKVYANHSGLGIDNSTDGSAGNALFGDKTIIIDFKNKKFGVK